jgi:hypothetical protein
MITGRTAAADDSASSDEERPAPLSSKNESVDDAPTLDELRAAVCGARVLPSWLIGDDMLGVGP